MARKIKAGADDPADDVVVQMPAREPGANVATADDMQRMFAIVKNAEAKYEAELAAIREKKTAAKAVRDKALTDAADAMKSRGISKRLLTELVALSKRKEEEVAADLKAWVWAIRAIGVPVGQQLAFFDDDGGFKGEDELLRRAEQQGYDASTEGASSTDSPYHISSPPGQAWMRGWTRSTADRVPK